MNHKRWSDLMDVKRQLQLTQEEVDEGWHFCWDWDGLLVGPEMKMEWECCTCYPKEHLNEG